MGGNLNLADIAKADQSRNKLWKIIVFFAYSKSQGMPKMS